MIARDSKSYEAAGKSYRPSNGTEGDLFMAEFCDRCSKCKGCEIIGAAMLFEKDHEEYPKEWVYDAEGCPTCTAFEKKGDNP